MSADAVAFFDDDQDPPQPAELARVEIPGDIPRGRGGRPKIRRLLQDGSEDPTTTVEYTRASSLGEVLEDHYAIHLREMRMVVWAIGHDPGLRHRIQAVPTHGPDREDVAHQRDRRSLREIGETALIVCRAEAGADRGTALHALTEQYDQGASMGHLDDDLAVGISKYAELMAGFEVVASEGFVVCDELEAAGSFDRIVTPRWPMEGPGGVVFEPGERLVVDVKTNADAKYFGPQYAVQQAVYAHGRPYSHEGGRQSWRVVDSVAGSTIHRPRQDWSLILHIPIESPEDAGLWWVDLTAGMELARAAAAARVLRRRAGMFLPVEPPAPPKTEHPPAVIDTCGCCMGDPETVCDACGEHACWAGQMTCDESRTAGTTTREEVAAERELDARRAEQTIVGLVYVARTLDDLGRIWERYGADGWTPACTAAANARADKLSPAAVPS